MNGKRKEHNKNENLKFDGEYYNNYKIKGKEYIMGKLVYEGEYLSDKILAICRVLEVSPEWLLSGTDSVAGTGEENGHYVINIQTRTGQMVERFNKLDKSQMDRVLGYLEALSHESDGVH